ncbi:MAG TPA: hypothetical protein VHO03_06170 [Ignavibacteriales bacterium]|nr:hypothetical protein [Ignavibacteriales bacterium]
MLNPEVARRYFYRNTTVPHPIEDLFFKEKPRNSFRVFTLGENPGAGFPYLPTASFSRYLERRLKAEYPSTKIEVINLSITAVNSFALRDLMPGVLSLKPDLIIIYAGNNEYYGALGAASTLPFGRSRGLINLMLYLQRFKTVELLSDAARNIFRLFRHDRQFGAVSPEVSPGLQIPYNSELFHAGIMQFEGNLRDILSMTHSSGVPVILGTLVCNLKDQPPFLSSSDGPSLSAEEVFINAVTKLKNQKTAEADSLFRLARDLDMLRFRAPEKINSVIKSLSVEFNSAVVKFDSLFCAMSPYGITGNDLMADHLHPNIQGYQLMGELFFLKMKEMGLLPKTNAHLAELNNSLFFTF